MVCSCRSVAAFSTSVSSSARSTLLAQRLERPDAVVHHPLPLDRGLEQTGPLGAHQLDVAAAGLGPFRQLARAFLEPLHFGHRGQRPARPARRAAARASAARWLSAWASSRASDSRRCASASAVVERRPLASTSRSIEAWASACRPSSRSMASRAPRASVATRSARWRTRASSAVARCRSASAPTIAFSCR